MLVPLIVTVQSLDVAVAVVAVLPLYRAARTVKVPLVAVEKRYAVGAEALEVVPVVLAPVSVLLELIYAVEVLLEIVQRTS